MDTKELRPFIIDKLFHANNISIGTDFSERRVGRAIAKPAIPYHQKPQVHNKAGNNN